MGRENVNENVYIMSIEGAKIWEHQKGKTLKEEYVGMLPDSLTLDKMVKCGMKVRTTKGKKWSRDVINVSFKQKVRSAKKVLSKIDIDEFENSIDELKNKIKQETKKKEIKLLQNKLDQKLKFKSYLEKAKKEDWKEIKVDSEFDKEGNITYEGLRMKLYKEGFKITFDDGKTIEYEVYKRSSSKSRTGKVLFLNKKLDRNKLIKWARLGMDLEGAEDVDFPSLLSYESLVDSALESRIHVPTNSILLVSDVKSIFKEDVNLVKKNDKTGLLESVFTQDYKMESDIFDGEGLLEADMIPNQKSMCLLRQHMFKSCVFACRINKFLKNYADQHNINFATWELEDMFGNKILAKNIRMITTPNSLKALKFSKKKKCDKVMYEHWKKKVKDEGEIFGIVKQEHKSQRGYDIEGNILNQTSYQMLGSINFDKVDLKELSKLECDYIMKLKNDICTYIKYLEQNANDMNSNQMWVDLYNVNNNIMHTEQFKEKRKKDIFAYVQHVRAGKLRLRGDYCTIIQNGKELLYHAIGKLPLKNKNELDYKAWEKEMILKENECYTTLHKFNYEYVAFRNPHTSMSNVLILKNKNCKFIEDYFQLSDNIIYTNAINFTINRILSGQDVDSDTLVLFDNDILLKRARDCYIKSSEYNVCENGVGKRPNKYKVCVEDMAKIDQILAKSQRYIGEVVNTGSVYLNRYYDMINSECKNKKEIADTLKGVDIATICSEISIDMAKRFYDINIKEQIDNLSLDVQKPYFMKFTANKKNTRHYKTSMDYLQELLDDLEDAEDIDSKNIYYMITKSIDSRKVKNEQVENIVKLINKLNEKNRNIEAKYVGITDEKELEEKYNKKDNNKNYYMNIISRFKITEKTIHKILRLVFRDKLQCKYKTELMNILYNTNKKEFLEVFKRVD